MKLSARFAARTKDLWREAAQKDFILQMAKGCLSIERFRNYMLQDYLYLLDYKGLLQLLLEKTGDPQLTAFIRQLMDEVESETCRVHLPNMKKIGISEQDIRESRMDQVLASYLEYMRKILAGRDLLAGLTALLQCSWVYAYIGAEVSARYPEEIAVSPYRDWFAAYTSPGYVETNRIWMDTLDRIGSGIDPEAAEELCGIFETCAEYENRFWDRL